MFKLVDQPEFTHDVAVMTPVDGGHKEETFKARFKVLPDEELKKHDLLSLDGQKALVRDVWVSASDIADDADKPLAWNDDLREQMLALPYVVIALLHTYTKAVTKQKAGN